MNILHNLLRAIEDIELDDSELREAVAWLQGYAKAIVDMNAEEESK